MTIRGPDDYSNEELEAQSRESLWGFTLFLFALLAGFTAYYWRKFTRRPWPKRWK